MFWIAPHQFATNLWIEPLPEACQVSRGLYWTVVRRKQVNDDRHLSRSYSRSFAHTEEVLQSGRNPGRLAVFIVDPRLPSALQSERFGRNLIQLPDTDFLRQHRNEISCCGFQFSEAQQSEAQLSQCVC